MRHVVQAIAPTEGFLRTPTQLGASLRLLHALHSTPVVLLAAAKKKGKLDPRNPRTWLGHRADDIFKAVEDANVLAPECSVQDFRNLLAVYLSRGTPNCEAELTEMVEKKKRKGWQTNS